eukprot:gb/GFBE01011285.1/.p1 GENE.gb/GFBE01011285.1/~~gb/GFBE01011285.1/.p1  ORF type:complete len:630 (+),score=50.51 gb/GFBE01011285.1/:1-1890(+)
MWARRCGAPERYPSWTRVIVQSAMNGAIGWVVFQYMGSISVSNLDLTRSSSVGHATPTCLTHWLRRNDISTWSDTQVWEKWFAYLEDADAYVSEHACAPEHQPGRADTCSNVGVPVSALQQKLGYPLGHGEKPSVNNDVLYGFAYLFAVLAGLNLVGFMIHDWALIHRTRKDDVLDWPGLNEGFPFIRNFGVLAGWRILRMLFSVQGRRKTPAFLCGILMCPLICAWSLIVLLFFLTPSILALFFCYPVRMSRFALFFILVATGIYGVAIVITQVVYLSSTTMRPRYALVWEVPDSAGDCYCGCSYPISESSLYRILAIGATVTFQSLLSAFRCLKGLRRTQWANLMSVMYPIPVAVFEVFWTRPDSTKGFAHGPPIQFRKEGEPVQGEKAFDPFALMDEQPESRFTTVTLKPEFAYDIDPRGRWKPIGNVGRNLDGPSLPKMQPGEYRTPTEVIGCCGFPCMTGGYQAIIVSDSEEEDEEAEEAEDVQEQVSTYARVALSQEGEKEPAAKVLGLASDTQEPSSPTSASSVLERPRANTQNSIKTYKTVRSIQSTCSRRQNKLQAQLAMLTALTKRPQPAQTESIPQSLTSVSCEDYAQSEEEAAQDKSSSAQHHQPSSNSDRTSVVSL